ncbi:hypothetical protein EBZ39_00035 [bacterium]|nr:hypothetical protein [bacterium]
MFNLLDFIAVIFAAGAIIEVWHKGSIFDTPRAYAQALQDVTPAESVKGRLLELLNCPFCKSYHVPVYLFLLLLAGEHFGGTIACLVRIIIYGLAATRIGNIVDGLLPNHLQYSPSPEQEAHGRAAATGTDFRPPAV